MMKKDKFKNLISEENKVDLQQLIIFSQNIKNKEKILNEFKSDNKGYISLAISKEILEKYPTSVSSEIDDAIAEIQPMNMNDCIDYENNTFSYGNNKFSFIRTEKGILFDAEAIAKFFGYTDMNKALSCVSDEHKFVLTKK
jgi:hypothetical protein